MKELSGSLKSCPIVAYLQLVVRSVENRGRALSDGWLYRLSSSYNGDSERLIATHNVASSLDRYTQRQRNAM